MATITQDPLITLKEKGRTMKHNVKAIVVGLALVMSIFTGARSEAETGVFIPYNFAHFYGTSPIPIPRQLTNAYSTLFTPIINNGFSFGQNAYSGLNTMNALISQVSGVPFVPIQLPSRLANSTATNNNLCFQISLVGQVCPNQNVFSGVPAASASNLNNLLGMFGMGVPLF